MKKTFVAILVGFTILSAFCSPLFGADFAPIFPKQSAQMVSSPNFTWTAGDYDQFCLLLFLPLKTRYHFFPIRNYKKPYFLIPETTWDSVRMNGWCFWLVFGRNTETKNWAITPLQFFKKVSDCVVEFPDPNLETAIREEINKPEGEIMASELQKITDFQPEWISDISGLEYLTKLEVFRPYWSSISDLSSLAGLANLDKLSIVSSQVNDISPLAGLSNLTEICLFDNQISDLGPIANLINLTDLCLSYNEISDISPLSGLTNLYGSDLSHNQINDISSLANLTNYHYLRLDNNQINDIKSIANLTNLRYIGLKNNKVDDIQPLSNLTNLASVDLESNNITDIYPLLENPGIDSGDHIWLNDNPLNSDSCNDYIPTLEDRGVIVHDDCP